MNSVIILMITIYHFLHGYNYNEGSKVSKTLVLGAKLRSCPKLRNKKKTHFNTIFKKFKIDKKICDGQNIKKV